MIITPAPTSRTRASMIWPMINELRNRSLPRPDDNARLPSFNVLFRSRWVARNALKAPKMHPTNTVSSSAKVSTWPSTRISLHPAIHFVMPGGRLARIRLMLQNDVATAKAPAISESSTVSLSRVCARRFHLAPSAVRIASSRCRPMSLANSRFTRLAQVRSKTKIAAAWTVKNMGAVYWYCISRRRMRLMFRFELVAGNSCESRAAKACNSERACATDVPDANRATTWSDNWFRSICSSGRSTNGTHTSIPTGKLNFSGMMPITTRACPFTWTARPITLGSPPKRRTQ